MAQVAAFCSPAPVHTGRYSRLMPARPSHASCPVRSAFGSRARVVACAQSEGLRDAPKQPGPSAREVPAWRPSGLLREAVAMKEVEMQLAEETMLERPDHPVQLRMSFYEGKSNHRFAHALRRDDGRLAIVAALKRFQPRPDQTRPDRVADLDDIGRETRILELAGVDAVFLNTDSMRYGCDVQECTPMAQAVAKSNVDRGVPIARQDLIIHPIQMAEAATVGASAVCIPAAAALPDLLELLNMATAMGIEAIVECHTELERDMALDAGANLLYLTNRDKTTNAITLGTAERLHRDIPAWVRTMGGGGLVTAGDTWPLLDAGFDAVVLGEMLLNTRRPQGLIDEIRTQMRPVQNPFDMNF